MWRLLKCIFLSKRLDETHAGGKREPGDRIHAISKIDICTSICYSGNSDDGIDEVSDGFYCRN